MADRNPVDHGRDVVQVTRVGGASGIVLICEHASSFIPPEFDFLGLPPAMRYGHAVWDPGALGVALGLSARLDAPLVAGGVSRLVYDCNRPAEAPSAMLTCSEGQDIPGNIGLTAAARSARVARYYQPFETAVRDTMDTAKARVLITVHSFTRVFMGQKRDVQIGILHDDDTRLADAMLACGAQHTTLRTERNAPYGPADGVTHTLRLHGLARGIPHVMLEVRNDLIATEQAQAEMAQMLAGWITQALATVEATA